MLRLSNCNLIEVNALLDSTYRSIPLMKALWTVDHSKEDKVPMEIFPCKPCWVFQNMDRMGQLWNEFESLLLAGTRYLQGQLRTWKILNLGCNENATFSVRSWGVDIVLPFQRTLIHYAFRQRKTWWLVVLTSSLDLKLCNFVF